MRPLTLDRRFICTVYGVSWSVSREPRGTRERQTAGEYVTYPVYPGSLPVETARDVVGIDNRKKHGKNDGLLNRKAND